MIKSTVIFFIALSIHQVLYSANYYFSSITGDDHRTAIQAQNPSTPWKTMDKLGSLLNTLKAGDSVLFKRGDVFDGRLFVSKSGFENAPIVFAAYGSGNRPVINGFTTISSWTPAGKNIYETPLNAGPYLNMLAINATVMAMGRWPNISGPSKGYLTIDNNTRSVNNIGEYTGGSFTDSSLKASPNWTGAQAVIRKRHWVIDRCRITNHSGNTITYLTASRHDINNGWGYFIQNSAETLDQQGEWYYNPTAKKLRLYSFINPSKFTVKAAVIDTLVYINNKSYITFDNLSFYGSDTLSMKIENNSSHISIQNCDFNYCGMRGITANNSQYIVIENCSFKNSNNESILFNDCSYSTIRNNTVKNVYMWRGMGDDTDGGTAIALVHENNSLIEYNNLDSLGQAGIAFLGSFITVKNNFVKNFTLVKDDGAGIYTWAGGFPGDIMHGRKIIDNIVINGPGAPEGTESKEAYSSNAFYVDDMGQDVEVRGNTGANVSSAGLYLHNTQNILVRDNTFYNNKSSQLLIVHDPIGFVDLDKNPANGSETEYPTTGLIIRNNILFGKNSGQELLSLSSLQNDLAKYGTFDSNYYVRPFDPTAIISANYQDKGTISASYDLSGWKNKYRWDSHSVTSPVVMPAYKASPLSETNKVANGSFDQNAVGIEPGTGCKVIWDNTKLDGGAMKVLADDKNSDADVGANIDLLSTVSGTTYRVKFSIIGSVDLQNLISYVRRWGGNSGNDYHIISDVKRFKLGTKRTECEFLFTAPTTDPKVKLTIIASSRMTPFWFDNIDVRPVRATHVNPDDSILFEYNATHNLKTVPLAGMYKDVRGKEYSGSININPFSSVILMKATETGKPR